MGRHLLVLRFSALGDVAMTVPVIKNLLAQHPSLRITFVSTPFCKPLFDDISEVDFIGIDFKNDYKGLGGLVRLAKKLKQDVGFDTIADLHNVLRTKVLRLLLWGKKSTMINKGRKEKAMLTRKSNKVLKPLKSTFQRYVDVFSALGFSFNLNINTGIKYKIDKGVEQFSFLGKGKKLIGIAPFAKHSSKMYPIEKMKRVVELLAQNKTYQVLLFGSKAEVEVLKGFELMGSNVFSCAGKYSFNDELKIISNLDVMISMDSANMHLASLYGIPVVSIWGGTHPYLGFYGWGQNLENAVQDDLACRPSSVFGNKLCPVHKEMGCMQSVFPEIIVKRVEEVMGLEK